MKKIILSIFYLTLSTLYTSCSNDLDINAAPKETMVIYGLLNPVQDTHYIKINKTFLTNSNVYNATSVNANTQYEDVLDVKVYGYNIANQLKDSLLFDRVMVLKENGVFPVNQPIYRNVEVMGKNLNPDYVYKLKVKNRETGYEVNANTNILGNLQMFNPEPEPFAAVINWNSVSAFYKIKFNTVKYGKFYDLKFKFYYKELVNGTTDTLFKQIDWNLETIRSSSLQGGEPKEVSIQGQRFYNTLKSAIPEKDNVKRWASHLDLYTTVATEDLDTYISANAPSNTPVQDKPSFTNINNGLGIFSSRINYVRKNIEISGTVATQLKTNPDTQNLNFQ